MFDLLLKSLEPVSAQHVAQELNTSVDGMERLLDALVGFEILDVEITNGTGGREEAMMSMVKSEQKVALTAAWDTT